MYIVWFQAIPLDVYIFPFFQCGDENQHKTTRMCFCWSREPASIDISLTTAFQQNNTLSSTKHMFMIVINWTCSYRQCLKTELCVLDILTRLFSIDWNIIESTYTYMYTLEGTTKQILNNIVSSYIAVHSNHQRVFKVGTLRIIPFSKQFLSSYDFWDGIIWSTSGLYTWLILWLLTIWPLTKWDALPIYYIILYIYTLYIYTHTIHINTLYIYYIYICIPYINTLYMYIFYLYTICTI